LAHDHEAITDYVAALDGVPTLLVGVTCPPTTRW
jgi:hypothetical protein